MKYLQTSHLDIFRGYKHRLLTLMRMYFGKQFQLQSLKPVPEYSPLFQVPVYCINLRTAKQKRLHIQKQILKLQLPELNIVDAINGHSLSIPELIQKKQYLPEMTRKLEERDLSVSEIAVTMSHFKAIEQTITDNKMVSCIIEDDAIFLQKGILKLRNVDLPSGWDIILLEGWYRATPPVDHISGSIYRPTSWRGGIGGYLISRSGAEKLLTIRTPIIHPADGYMVWYERHRHIPESPIASLISSPLNVYLAFPRLLFNGSGSGHWASSIGTGVIPY
jgi:hypothetical protein